MILSVLGVIFITMMPESPRFLVSQKRFAEARQIFDWIGKHNGLKDEEIMERLSRIRFEDEDEVEAAEALAEALPHVTASPQVKRTLGLDVEDTKKGKQTASFMVQTQQDSLSMRAALKKRGKISQSFQDKQLKAKGNNQNKL